MQYYSNKQYTHININHTLAVSDNLLMLTFHNIAFDSHLLAYQLSFTHDFTNSRVKHIYLVKPIYLSGLSTQQWLEFLYTEE